MLFRSVGKQVAKVSQSSQQHIPAGAGVVVGAHSSSQCATHAAKTTGLVGHPPMHADSVPPGQPLGTGLGAGVVGAGAAVVVAAGQSALHTEMHASYAAPVTTEQAATQALIDPPGHGDGLGGEGGEGGKGPGVGPGAGAGQLVSTALAASCLTWKSNQAPASGARGSPEIGRAHV